MDFLPEAQNTAAAEDAIACRKGSGSTRTYLGPDRIIRCWKLSTRYDCLYAQVSDLREEIADAPVRRTYYRFLTSRLPDRMKQLDGLDISDGYECSTSSSRDLSSLLEAIWKNGRIVEKSHVNQQISSETTWKPEEIAALFAQYAVTAQRPAFACSLADEITTKMGLEALDSPLVTYEALMQIDRPANAADQSEEVGPKPSQQP